MSVQAALPVSTLFHYLDRFVKQGILTKEKNKDGNFCYKMLDKVKFEKPEDPVTISFTSRPRRGRSKSEAISEEIDEVEKFITKKCLENGGSYMATSTQIASEMGYSNVSLIYRRIKLAVEKGTLSISVDPLTKKTIYTCNKYEKKLDAVVPVEEKVKLLVTAMENSHEELALSLNNMLFEFDRMKSIVDNLVKIGEDEKHVYYRRAINK
jgi:hypothetical protein